MLFHLFLVFTARAGSEFHHRLCFRHCRRSLSSRRSERYVFTFSPRFSLPRFYEHSRSSIVSHRRQTVTVSLFGRPSSRCTSTLHSQRYIKVIDGTGAHGRGRDSRYPLRRISYVAPHRRVRWDRKSRFLTDKCTNR